MNGNFGCPGLTCLFSQDPIITREGCASGLIQIPSQLRNVIELSEKPLRKATVRWHRHHNARGSMHGSSPCGHALLTNRMGCRCQALARSQALSSHSHREDKLQYKGSISLNLCGIGKPVFWKTLPLFSFWRNFLSLISITCRLWLRRAKASAVQFSLEPSSATRCYKTLIRLEITQTHGAGAVTDFKLWSTRLTTKKHWWEGLRRKTWTNFHGKVGLV